MELLKIGEVAQILRLAPFTVRQMLKTGRIKAIKLDNGQWRVSREDLERYLQGK